MPDWPVPQAVLDKLSQRLLDATNAAYFTPVEQPQWAGANIIPIFEQGYYLRYDRLFEAWGMNRNGVQVRNPGASGVFYAIAHDSVTTLATVYVKNMVAAGPDKSRRALAAGVLATAAKQHVEVDALIY